MEQRQSNTRVAGVDVGKRRLDAAVYGLEGDLRVDNTDAGIGELIAWLRARDVSRVGLEASGGYERRVRAALEESSFDMVVHQPLEVRRFAQLKRRRAKNDRQDAQLIAAATAQTDAVRAAQDPRLVELADRLTAYEQITDQAAELKTFLESVTLAEVAVVIRGQIRSLELAKAELATSILRRIKAQADFFARFQLLLSLPGVGSIVAAALVIRMPELGSMRRGQAASLLGVAPFDRDSGQWKGLRFISGGRARPRRLLYLAALVAKRLDPSFKAFAQRLQTRGKPAKLVVVAVMRKLIEAANLVLHRAKPWNPRPAS